VQQSVASAYHLNARTPQDYRRLAEFIDGRAEVTDVSFEFGTGRHGRSGADFTWMS
jgi:hypothetical protein